jgi:hypothetical protein
VVISWEQQLQPCCLTFEKKEKGEKGTRPASSTVTHPQFLKLKLLDELKKISNKHLT